MKKELKKAVGYIRVSTSIQAKEGESLSTQKQQIEEYAKSKGWKLDHIYSDEGISGTKIEYRTDFKKLIEDAKQGHFEVVIFTKLSRFARNAREYLNLFHELQEHGITLVSIKENIDPTTSTGRTMAGILALFAEWEHETIKEQMYENRMARWKEHRTFIGTPPYAYQWNKETKQLEIKEKEGRIYSRIVDMYLNQKMSFQDIALKLREEGIKCNKKYWSSSTISYTLKNPAYYGNYVVNKYIYEDGVNGAGTKRTKKRKQNSEHITFPIQPLISKSQWDQIQKQIEFNKLKSKRSNRTYDLIMRDVLICGRCGGRVKPRIGNVRKDGSVTRYYACYWASTSKKNLLASGRNRKCSLPFIKTDRIEKGIWSELMIGLSLNPKNALDQLSNSKMQQNKMTLLQEKIDRLERDLSKKNRSREKLYELLEMDTDLIDLIPRLQKSQDEILSLESKINNTKLEYMDLQKLAEKKEEALNFLSNHKYKIRTLIKDIYELSADDRKILLESMLTEKVFVHYEEDSEEFGPGGVNLDYKLKWNPVLLQTFMNEGKITNLNQNGTTHFP